MVLGVGGSDGCLVGFVGATVWESDDTQDMYEVGDISNKFGFLTGNDNYYVEVSHSFASVAFSIGRDNTATTGGRDNTATTYRYAKIYITSILIGYVEGATPT